MGQILILCFAKRLVAAWDKRTEQKIASGEKQTTCFQSLYYKSLKLDKVVGATLEF